MNFSIKCQTFIRFASICSFFEPSTRPDVKEKINTVRLENKNGKCYAIATNEKIAAVEFLHNTDQPDGYIHLVLDEGLLQQCKTEMMFDSKLHITAVEQLAVASAKTDLGYNFNGNCCYWFDDSPLNNWRKWIPKVIPAESTGAMYWNTHQIESLMKSSPSGHVIFPEFINATQPVLVRDIKDPNWFGLFIPENITAGARQAELPDWIKDEI